MLTKSKIQLLKERYEIANNYREGLENLMDKYIIEDSVFIYMNGMVEAGPSAKIRPGCVIIVPSKPPVQPLR
jgi:hypothetical protein